MKKGFTLAEVLMAMRVSIKKCLKLFDRTSEPKEPLRNMKGNMAFTLAEVLITLAIIGVVASLTIPVVIQNYKRHEAQTRLKKFFSSMNNAVKLAEIEQNQPVYSWDYSLSAVDFWNKYLASHVNCKFGKRVSEEYRNPGYGWFQADYGTLNRNACYFADGTFMTFFCTNANTDKRCVFSYDINGIKKPNTRGIDEFDFAIGTYDGIKCPYLATPLNANKCKDSYKMKTGAADSPSLQYEFNLCKDLNKTSCTFYLFLNNWDFSNYPHKL